MRARLVPFFAAALALAACDAAPTGPEVEGPAFAHESNNRAELIGDGVTGHAIVNFVQNSGNGPNWRSTVHLQGLEAGSYDFYVTLNGTNATLVCSFDVSASGAGGCSADTNVPGFNMAEIRTSGGDVVASGGFARRGGNRFEP